MAERKKPFMCLETKEEFDEIWNSAYQCGYGNGFNDGRIDALAIFQNAIEEWFTPEEESGARDLNRRKAIAKWKKEEHERELRRGVEVGNLSHVLNRIPVKEDVDLKNKAINDLYEQVSEKIKAKES